MTVNQVWVAAFDEKEPITVKRIEEKIEHLRSIGRLRFSITLTHQLATQSTKYQGHQVYFDQFCPVSCGSLVDPHPLTPWSDYVVHLPTRPSTSAT